MTPAETLTTRIGGQWHRTYGTALVFAHDDKNPSLSIFDGDSGPLLVLSRRLRKAGDCRRTEALRPVGDFLAGEKIQRPRKPKRSPEETQ